MMNFLIIYKYLSCQMSKVSNKYQKFPFSKFLRIKFIVLLRVWKHKYLYNKNIFNNLGSLNALQFSVSFSCKLQILEFFF